MGKHFYIVLLSLVLSLQLNAQPASEKLTGTIIGTTNCFDYDTYECSTTVNTTANAFDGDLQTIFASCERSGGWAGLDLGVKHIITRIAYCPRPGNPERMLSGLFEGSNNPDFILTDTLFVITETPAENTLTPKTIDCPIGFRYVRYIGPYDMKCNLTELEFYGYQGEGENSAKKQLTNSPMVIINTTDRQDIVDKDTYLEGTISVITENGAKIFTDSLKIKGRGNASWSFPKKPYKIKLAHKTNMLNMPAKAKEWTLINNYGDKTLMRNLLAFDLSKRLDIPYTPAGKSVDLYLNGDYKGCYQLCDQIEVGGDRVEVDKMDSSNTSLPELSGGYLIEMDAYADQASSFTSSTGIPVTYKYPDIEDIVPAQQEYLQTQFRMMEDALYGANYTSPTTGYRKYIDIDSFIRHFLVGEFSGNTDTYWSTYLYKKRNDDRFYFGPVWDFDLAYENDSRTHPINDLNDWVYATKGSSANGVKNMIDRLLSDPTLLTKMKSTYANYRIRGTLSDTALLKVVDDYAAEIDQSQKFNFVRWNILDTYVHMNFQVTGSYAAEVEVVKTYIRDRIAWMDTKLSFDPTLLDTNLASDLLFWNEGNILHIDGITEKTYIQIYDMTGKIIRCEFVAANYVANLSEGVYLIRTTKEDGKSKVTKCLIP